MVGFSINNLIWSNTKGPVLNLELGLSDNTALKLETGYFFWTSYKFPNFDRFPEHLEPNIKKFSGFQFLTEYKLYRPISNSTDFVRKYFSAYYQYRHLAAGGDMIVEDQSQERLIYQAYDNEKREIINEIGIKYGWLTNLKNTRNMLLLLDIYIGLGYQFVIAQNNSEAQNVNPEDLSFHTRKLKNPFFDSSFGEFPESQNYSVPTLRFGINLNFAY